LPKQLTTQNALITTVAVEVKALTISGKQVTQSVFRQLQEARLVAYEGTLNGVPWGYVNHCPERKFWDVDRGEWESCNNGKHLHVVWQHGGELRRSRIAPPALWPRPHWSDVTDAYVQALFCANGHKYPPSVTSGYGSSVAFEHNGTNCKASYPNGHRSDECTADRLAELVEELTDDIGREHDRRARHRAVWQSLTELPQLFIAV
jgi:hypothetical protein